MNALRSVRTALVAGQALLGLAAAAASLPAQVVVGTSASGIPVPPGGFVTVPVVVDMTGSGGFSLGSVTATLSWKPSTMAFVGAATGGFGAPVVNPDSLNGTLRFAVANPAGAAGQVVVLLATFAATGPAGDTTYLNVAVSELTAATSFTSLTPVTTAALVCVGASAGVWGDVDNSSTITSFDALLVVTHAVGLPITPHAPALGDVDADGLVTTRDALIILSHVVGLPTTGYRPGQSVGSVCAGNPPEVVVAAPTSLALVIGDTVAATAQAVDSVGQITSVPGMAWTTLNPAVATVGPTGRIAAVGAGVTGAVVVAAPGVMDTVGVTVVTTRQLWYVDAAAAAQNQQETGSPAYPFGSLQPAVDRAAPGDTILVRGGTYGAGARSTKPLTVIGVPGFPVPRFGGPIEFDSIGLATVRLQRLAVGNATGGIKVRGTGAGAVVVLDSVAVDQASGPGVELSGLDSVALNRVRVVATLDKGIAATDVRALSLFGVLVDGVSLAGGSGTGLGLAVLRGQLVAADSSSFRLGSVAIDTVAAVQFHRVGVMESNGGLLAVKGAASVVLDTVSFRMGGVGTAGYAVALEMLPGAAVFGREMELRQLDGHGLLVANAATATFERVQVEAAGGVAATFPDVGRVEVHGGSFRNGELSHFDALLVAASVMRLDSVEVQHGRLRVNNLDTLIYRVGWLTGPANGPLLAADLVPVVSLFGLEVAGADQFSETMRVVNVDSLRADSLYVHDNQAIGLYVAFVRTAAITGSRFVRNNLTSYYTSTVDLSGVATARVAQSVFDEANLVTSLRWMASGATPSLTVDTTVLRGSGLGVYASSGVAAQVTVRGSAFERGLAGYGRQLVWFSLPGRVRVLDSRADSTDYGYFAIDGYADTLDVQNSVLDFVGSGIGLVDYSGVGGMATLTGNTLACRTGSYGNYTGIRLTNTHATIAGNTVSGCWTGIYANASSGTRTATVTGNAVTALDTVYGEYGIGLYGSWRQTAVSGNTVSGGRMYAGIHIAATGTNDTVRVDSNTVEDGIGKGIYVVGQHRGTRVWRNTIQRMRPLSASSDAALYAEFGFGTDTLRIADNRLLQNRSIGMYLDYGSGGPPIRLDTNVVVDDSLVAVKVENGTTVVGRGNFLARNAEGLYAFGAVAIDSSVIQQSTSVGARYVGGAVTLMNNYWGHASGPRCDTGCVGALGDSLVGSGQLNYVPFLTTPPATPIATPPALRPAPAFPAPRPALRVRAVEPAWFTQQRRALAWRREDER